MKTTARTDAAKFFCGFETFHTISHTVFWLSGTTLTYLGMTVTPTVSAVSALINAVIAVGLGIYAWGGKPAVARPPRGMVHRA